jgi:RNA-binding protein with serine-rich domain 1
MEMDVADQNSVTNAAVHLSGEKIDVLVNSTDVLIRGGLEDVSDHDFLKQLQVNTLGSFLVTRAFLPNLRIAVSQVGFAKVINMGSRMGSIADNISGGLYGYRASKAGLHMVSKSLAIDLKHEKIAVLLVQRGHDATETAAATAESSPSARAEKMVKLIDHAGIQDTGKFLYVDGREVPW